MVNLDDFIETSFLAKTPEDLHAAFRRAILALGFEHYACTFLRPGETSADAVAVAVTVRYPAAWVSHYIDRGYSAIDPVITRSTAAAAPYAWKELTGLSAQQERLFNEAAEAGLRGGVCVPVHSSFGEVFVMSAASSLPEVDPRRSRDRLYLLAAQFRLAYLGLSGATSAPTIPVVRLSERERECLSWSARGKSSWDIGGILGISEFTANFHVRNACAKLQAGNRILAIAKAIRLGLIDP